MRYYLQTSNVLYEYKPLYLAYIISYLRDSLVFLFHKELSLRLQTSNNKCNGNYVCLQNGGLSMSKSKLRFYVFEEFMETHLFWIDFNFPSYYLFLIILRHKYLGTLSKFHIQQVLPWFIISFEYKTHLQSNI